MSAFPFVSCLVFRALRAQPIPFLNLLNSHFYLIPDQRLSHDRKNPTDLLNRRRRNAKEDDALWAANNFLSELKSRMESWVFVEMEKLSRRFSKMGKENFSLLASTGGICFLRDSQEWSVSLSTSRNCLAKQIFSSHNRITSGGDRDENKGFSPNSN